MPGYADIQYIEMSSPSNYHSMQTQLNKRFSKGLMFGVSWTWSKSMNLVNNNGDAINPFLDFRMRNYGKGNFDRTHNFVFNYAYSVPKLSNVWDNPVAKWVFDNWDIAGVTSLISGAPSGVGYSLVSGADIVGGGGAGVDSRINVIANPILPKGERTELKHFNTAVFAPPTKAELGIGNAPKDVFRLPGTNVFDVSFYKNIPLSSKANVTGSNSALSSTTSSTTPASRVSIPQLASTPLASRSAELLDSTPPPWTRAAPFSARSSISD